MSLINDALKRAKEAQQQVEPRPASLPQFKPVEPGQARNSSPILPLASVAALVLVLGLIIGWFAFGRSRPAAAPKSASAQPANPVATAPQNVAPAPAPAPVPPVAAPQQPVASAQPAASTEAVPPPGPIIYKPRLPYTPAASNEPSATASATPPPATVPAVTTTAPAEVVAAEPQPPRPPPLRLQGIIYSPTRPAAMINGKTVFVGDKLGDWRVAGIDTQTATLIADGKTNVLALPQ